jgi:hypothetical protein
VPVHGGPVEWRPPALHRVLKSLGARHKPRKFRPMHVCHIHAVVRCFWSAFRKKIVSKRSDVGNATKNIACAQIFHQT